MTLTVPTIRIFPGWLEPRNQKWRRLRDTERAMRAERWLRAYVSLIDGLTVIVGWEVDQGWHLSISHQQRYPTWNEIRDARYDLIPDAVTMALLLPPRSEYVNVHPNCFHLHQLMESAA